MKRLIVVNESIQNMEDILIDLKNKWHEKEIGSVSFSVWGGSFVL